MTTLTCIATEVITTRQKPIGYAYRTAPAMPNDSGWRFLSGSESEKYMNQPSHYITCVLADFALAHPDVAHLLDHLAGSAFERASAAEPFEAVQLD